MERANDTHSLAIGYVLWIFGFMGAHRFYFGKPVSGTIWLLTGGLFLVGWIVDLFLMPSLERSAERRYRTGGYSYNLAWVLLTFLGVFGVHRIYMAKIWTGVLYLLTGGLFFLGVLYDFWTLNAQVDEANAQSAGRALVTP